MIPTEGKNEAQPFTTGFPIFSSSCRTKKHTHKTDDFLMGDAFIVSARLGDLLYALGRQKYGKD